MGFIEQTEDEGEADSSNDEHRVASDRVRGTNTKLFELAKQFQKDVIEGRLGLGCHDATSGNTNTKTNDARFVSE